MFSLISGFWKWFITKQELRFLIVGLDNAGKTTTLEQLKRIYSCRTPRLPFDKVTPTIGLNLCNLDFDWSTSGVFWDLGGQLMLRGIWEKHYSECDGMVFVFDSTDGDRLCEAKATLVKVLNHPILRQREVPLIILINKQDDTDHAISVKSILEYLGLQNLLNLSQEMDDSSSLMISYPHLVQCQLPTIPTEESISLSHVLLRESAGPTLVCVSACSAVKNVNIKPAIDCLVHQAKYYAEQRRKEGEQQRS